MCLYFIDKYYLEALPVPKKDDLIPHVQSEVPPPNQQNSENQPLPCDVRERMYLIVRSL